MNKITLKNDKTSFEAISLKAPNPSSAVVFATGSGGNPERHLPLLNSLVESGSVVIAPYFERIISHKPSKEELHFRADSLALTFDYINKLNLPMIGIGHSIGATVLIGLGGGQIWMKSGQRLSIEIDERIKKLILFTPPTDFFQVPNSLDAVVIPIQVWAGSLDTITPPQQIVILKHSLPKQASLNVHIIEGAGHFSFMNNLPPNIIDPMKNRDEFLAKLSLDVCKFVKGISSQKA